MTDSFPASVWRLLSVLALLLILGQTATDPLRAADPPATRLLIAVSSYKDRVQHPQLFLYLHDGIGHGEMIEPIPAVAKRSDHHPAFSADGRYCVFASEAEGSPCVILVYDRVEKKFVDLPGLNETPHAQAAPGVDAGFTFIAAEAWARPMQPGLWDLIGYDVATKKVVPLTEINTSRFNERNPVVSLDGRWLAWTTDETAARDTDILLAVRESPKNRRPAPWNSKWSDTEPALSGDGRWLAFVSNRPGGVGGRDVYLLDTTTGQYVPMQGVNSPGHEQAPTLSADGRYLLFVSEPLEGAGERDVLLFDCQLGKLLPTPGLNSARDEMDPAIVVIPAPVK